jgi:hypothetical protein
MAKKSNLYIAKLSFGYGGESLEPGQVVSPVGERNDYKLFGDNTYYFMRFDGEPEECGTDGCKKRFANLGTLQAHRQRVHAPEREFRDRRRVEIAQERARMERDGESIGGVPVIDTKPGPRGEAVPYVDLTTKM